MDADQIQSRIVDFIEKYQDIDSRSQSDADFNALALELFKYQFQNNRPFQKYAQSQRKNPLVVNRWQEIPVMPIQGYKQLTLSTTPITEGEAVFMSSGTTDPTHRSRNFHPSFRVWDASMRYPFKQYVMPDCDRMTIIGLFPGDKTNSRSSLSRYVSKAVEFFGDQHSGIFIDENGMDYQGIAEALNQAINDQRAVMLLGASFSYVHLLDYLAEHQLSFDLPQRSRLFDTGGFKGQSRTIKPGELFDAIEAAFGIDRNHYINMYGMTEVCSQCYDQNLVTLFNGEPVNFLKQTPAWVRVQILDTDTLTPVADGQTGLIAYYDLSNCNSSFGLLTEDLGIQSKDGFKLLGRVEGAEAKGCSIAADQLLKANEN